MAAKKRKTTSKPRVAAKQTPPPVPRRRGGFLIASVVALATVVALVIVLTVVRGSDGDGATAGLPNTPDYHSLLVSTTDPHRIVLGTHNGLYVSDDAGAHWTADALAGSDAMNLARPNGRTIWLAGHEVFKKSTDAGAHWADVRPTGLPGLDIHGFTVDPRRPATLYAAVAGRGLYRSQDGGNSFTLVSDQVGGDVMALAVLPNGRILAGDMRRGLLESRDGGERWQLKLRAQVMGLAVNPRDPRRILATGPGIALSTNGGGSWQPVLELAAGVGPVAWTPSAPAIAYAVGLDRTFYRSTDGGRNWAPVSG